MKKKKKRLLSWLENSRFASLLQFVKFGLVGLSNTAISYTFEMLGYYIAFAHVNWPESVRVVVVTAIAFFVSVTNSYYWNNRYVFTSKDCRTLADHVHAYIRTVLCYGTTGLVFSPLIKLWLVRLGIAYWMAALGSLVVSIPLNFVLNKYWAFNSKKSKMKEKG